MTENDGFKWYKTTQDGKYGAEDYNHNTLISLSRGYTLLYYSKETGKKGYFHVTKNGKDGACDLTGKEVIAPLYESAFYSTVDGFKYKTSTGSYVAVGWELDSEGRAIERATKTIEFSVELILDKGEILSNKTKYKFRYECYNSHMEFKVFDDFSREVEAYKFIPSTSILTYGNGIDFGSDGYGKSIKI